jgi:hypothetical protein
VGFVSAKPGRSRRAASAPLSATSMAANGPGPIPPSSTTLTSGRGGRAAEVQSHVMISTVLCNEGLFNPDEAMFGRLAFQRPRGTALKTRCQR